MDYFQTVATISLVIQIVVLVLLLGGYWLKRNKKFRQHGITMLTAVVLHLIVILAWMIPSFSGFFSIPSAINFADLLTAILLVHAPLGIATVILGIWLVASWRLQADVAPCFAKKKIMRVTLALWLITLALGIILYLKILQLF